MWKGKTTKYWFPFPTKWRCELTLFKYINESNVDENSPKKKIILMASFLVSYKMKFSFLVLSIPTIILPHTCARIKNMCKF